MLGLLLIVELMTVVKIVQLLIVHSVEQNSIEFLKCSQRGRKGHTKTRIARLIHLCYSKSVEAYYEKGGGD